MISVKLVAIAKDEAPYLPTWIFHHFYIGIGAIDIYLNGIEDNSYEIVQKIAKRDRRLRIFNADNLLELSMESGRQFQQEVYNFALKTERLSCQNTHMLFLDIDEYLMPFDFNQKINKLLSKEKLADVISFLWYSDVPSSNRQSFEPLIQQSIKMQKMSPVKSMCRLNGKAMRAKIHRFGFGKHNHKENSVQHILSNGSPAAMSSIRPNQISIEENSKKKPDVEPWFIYHQMFRSHNEYCSSLMRGRASRGVNEPIKNNRRGYCIHTAQIEGGLYIGDAWNYKISPWLVHMYNLQFALFMKRIGISSLVEEGRKINFRRFKKLRKLIKEDPSICLKYSDQLRGTRFQAKV